MPNFDSLPARPALAKRVGRKSLYLAALLGGLAAQGANAVELSYSGFATVGAGKVLSGANKQYLDIKCPCYVANWPQMGVYDRDVSFDPDTRAGLQITAKIDDKLSFTTQIEGQGSNEFEPNIDWAYGTYDVTNTVSVQAGRKRLPLFQYSDYFNVGYAYPWIRPPADLYGWQIVAYNGANVMYRTNINNIGVTANVWAGREADSDNELLGKLYYGVRTEETWKNIFGGYVDFNFDAFSVRAVAMTNKVDRWLHETAGRTLNKDGVRQNFYGLSANVDWKNIVVRTELNRFVRPDEPKDIYDSYLVGVGYRFGNVLPMVTYSDFKQNFRFNPAENEIHNTTTFSLRWDFRPDMAFKLQYDHFKDKSAFDFVGNSKTLAASIDMVF